MKLDVGDFRYDRILEDEDLFTLDAADAEALRDALSAFLAMQPVSGGGAKQTAGDRACKALPPWVEPKA